MAEPTEADDKDEAQTELAGCGLQYGIYRHYKGGYYVLYSKSVLESHLEVLVHYYSFQKKTRWTRTLADFTSKVKVDGQMVYRFEYIREASPGEMLAAYDNKDLLEVLQGMTKGLTFLNSIKV